MDELVNELPEELKKILNKIEYVEDGGILINSVGLIEDNLKVELILSFGAYEIPNQNWSLNITGIKKEKIVINWAAYPEIYSDHILLYEFLDKHVDLYFNSKASDSERLFIELYTKHEALFGKWIDFGSYIHIPKGYSMLCSSQNGLFARGPKKILEEYNKCLISNEIKTTFVGEIESEYKALKLLILGDSYFIGENFEFERIN